MTGHHSRPARHTRHDTPGTIGKIRLRGIDPEPGGNTTAYTYPQDPINMFDLDGHWGWFKKAWQSGKSFYNRHRTAINIGLTAASFVPGVGIAGWAIRGASWAVRGARAYNTAKKMSYARKLSSTRNAGRARVTIETRHGKNHYDLYGRSHGGVATPHKYTHYYGKAGYMGKKGRVVPMGWRDLLTVRRYLRR